jgi:hypothetical protein
MSDSSQTKTKQESMNLDHGARYSSKSSSGEHCAVLPGESTATRRNYQRNRQAEWYARCDRP